jgi:replicative DNA helicase
MRGFDGNGNGSEGGHGAASSALAPPHSLEAEHSVLGAILLSERAMYALVIEEGLKPDDFYRRRHQLVYEAMLTLYNESEPIDHLTVTEHLRSAGCSGRRAAERRRRNSRRASPRSATHATTRASCASTR